MKKSTIAIRLAMSTISAPGLATAQTPVTTALQTFVATPQYQANIARLFAGLPADVFQRCAGLVSAGSKVTVVAPVTFAGDGRPISGLWKQSFPVSGCGNDTTINFFFQPRADKTLASIVAAPGDTHADLTLQRDAARFALMAVSMKAKTCTTPHIRTTRYDGEAPQVPGNTSPAARPGWHETWTISACGPLLRVGMRFVPDATGTQIVTETPQPLF